MTQESDVTALEQMLHYAAKEAKRLRVPRVAVDCLRMAAHVIAAVEGRAEIEHPVSGQIDVRGALPVRARDRAPARALRDRGELRAARVAHKGKRNGASRAS